MDQNNRQVNFSHIAEVLKFDEKIPNMNTYTQNVIATGFVLKRTQNAKRCLNLIRTLRGSYLVSA